MSGTTGRALNREILALAVPALGALAADPLASLVDTAFVGRIGTPALGALGVASAIFALAFFVFNFLAFGTTPLVAESVGRGDPEAASRTVVGALVTALVIGAGALVLLEAAAVPILDVMGAEGEVAGPALTYLRIRALATPAVLVILAGHGAFRGYQNTTTPLLVAVGLNAINVVLDPVLIFGLDWGIAGAAWATVVAQWAGAAAFLALLLGPAGRRLGIVPARPRLGGLGRFFTVSRHLLIRTSALVATLTLATAVATRVGTVAVAAHQVAIQLWVFLALVVDALAIAAQALVARYLGAGDRGTARVVGSRLLAGGTGIGLLLMAVMAALAPVLPGAFTNDPDVIARVRSVYPFVVLMQPVNAVVFVWDGVAMGATAFRYLAGATVAAAVAGGAVLLLTLPAGWGLAGVWWGITALMGVRLVTLAWWWAADRAAQPAAAG